MESFVLLEDDSISEYNLKEIQMYLRRLAMLENIKPSVCTKRLYL
jgi:hypothetical protein